jgi:predicted nucleotidyltransferase
MPELTAVLHELVAGTQAILADNFVAAYLQGSLAMGDWDSHSDMDFIIAIRHEVTAVELAALQALHGRIHELPSVWARRLDGSYFPLPLLAQTLAFIHYALTSADGYGDGRATA